MPRKSIRSETRCRYFIRKDATAKGWDTRHVSRGGHFLEENEIESVFPNIGLSGNKPDFLLCLGGEPAVVIEAKNKYSKIEKAINEATAYADQINNNGKYKVRIAIGAAGEEDTGFIVKVKFLSSDGWISLKSHNADITSIPTTRETELALLASDGTTTISIPATHQFIDSAIEISQILRLAKIEAPLRPKLIGAIVAAMYHGGIDTTSDNALDSINSLVRRVISSSVDLVDNKKDQLIDALNLSKADFNRLSPYIRRVESILLKLNIKAVLNSDTDFLGMFYEAFLRYGYDNNALGIVFTPRHITKMCIQLTKTNYKDRVIDIACGTGGFLVSAYDAMTQSAPSTAAIDKVKNSIYGFESNPTVWALSLLNMFFRGDGKSNIHLGNCFAKENVKSVSKKFTKAFLNPPFSQTDEPEYMFLDSAMDALEPDGVLAAVVYAGIFADNDHKLWRKEFLRRHTLLGIISLPEDLFYPTAAPTSIIIAKAHVPQNPKTRIFMARISNDGFEKLKNRRVEREGSEIDTTLMLFESFQKNIPMTSKISTVLSASQLVAGDEWSPQKWLPYYFDSDTVCQHQQQASRSIFQSLAQHPELSKVVLDDFPNTFGELPSLEYNTTNTLDHFFNVSNGKSIGEKNYNEGDTPYISSGDTYNSIIRLVESYNHELFEGGGITITAFGTAAIQPWPFIARGNGGSAVRVLVPKFKMTFKELLWFVSQINMQKWRFFYARMAIKTRIRKLEVTSPSIALVDESDPISKRVIEFSKHLDRVSSF